MRLRARRPAPPDAPLRLQLLCHSYWPEHSPPQRRWQGLITAFRGRGWDVDVVAPVAHFPEGRRRLPRDQAGRLLRPQQGPHGERVHRVPYIPHRGTAHAARLIDQLVSAALSVPVGLLTPRPDALVVTAPSLPILLAGYLLARLRRVPLVVEMRDAWPDLARDARLVKGTAKSLIERVVEYVQARADLVVAVTAGFAQTLRDRGVDPVVTISNGLDLSRVPALPPVGTAPGPLRALYLGNHGESQRLDVLVRASALVGEAMELHLVGHGVQRPALIELARELNAPVVFHESVHGPAVLEQYTAADTCIVSLRDDWKSFETTVPSKTYEVLAIGRHVTAVVRGEAERIVRDAGAGNVVASDPEAIAALWRRLAADRALLLTTGGGRRWVAEHADHRHLADRYARVLRALVDGEPIPAGPTGEPGGSVAGATASGDRRTDADTPAA
ncbi:glycosyltransferase WbuB [Tersicoccus solisilvae]|uniref:D-inositol 3-phosphate glycosyltransferase n=1 Tax=Tersicoccus solisilvae TaxID=1882339 RepID=A0ABQ1P2R0_9MICC|nr:glycosyltransferase family 4 protein [Tersicoccus solisilvae]GGC90000.1 glycosyltransferase WbuB [Tersicoccus solisilvae]